MEIEAAPLPGKEDSMAAFMTHMLAGILGGVVVVAANYFFSGRRKI